MLSRANSPHPAAAFKIHNGALTFLLDGSPAVPLAADVGLQSSAASIRACAKAGVHLYRLRHLDLGWTDATGFDHTALETRVHLLLTADPEARFYLEVSVDAPAWWREANPADCAVYCLSAGAGADCLSASWASERWRKEAGGALTRFVRTVQRAAWGAHCLGYQIAAGEDGEWRMPHPERLPDIGPRMTEQFRSFLLDKYRRNTGLLRKAWFNARADFNTIACPTQHDRNRTDFGVFRNPARSRRLLDYYECVCNAQNAAALQFCSLVKHATGGRALVGLAYATLFDRDLRAESGHGFPEPVLNAPEVDFFANAGPPACDTYLRALPGSLALRDKFLFHIPHAGQLPHTAAALAQTHNAGLILPVETPADTLRFLHQIFNQASRVPARARQRVSQVAVIVDPANVLYCAQPEPPEPWLNQTLLQGQLRELTHLGAPFDVYLLADLFHPQFPQYKVMFFINIFYLSEAERRRVDARVKHSHQTAIWLWAPGIIAEGGILAQAGEQLCGQKLRLEPAATALRMRIVETNDPLTWGHHLGASFGVDRSIAPTITIPDKSVMRLGANSANKTAFAIHRFPQWTSIVFGTAPVPAALLRNALRAAGCHLYREAAGSDDIVLTDAHTVVIIAERGGDMQISLPGPYHVTDAETSRRIAANASEFTVTLPPAGIGHYLLHRPGTRTQEVGQIKRETDQKGDRSKVTWIEDDLDRK